MLNPTSESKSCFSRASLNHSGSTTFGKAWNCARCKAPVISLWWIYYLVWTRVASNFFTVYEYRIYSKSAALYKRHIMFNSEMRLRLNDYTSFITVFLCYCSRFWEAKENERIITEYFVMRKYELYNNQDSTCGLIAREVCLHDSM